jgi:hypothetical protein
VFHIYVAGMLHVLVTCGLSYHFQVANSKLKKALKSEQMFNEEEKAILWTWNQEMERELEALKVGIA